MRKLALATAAAAALMFTAPAFTGVGATPASAETVVKKKVVIKHGDRGRHMGWRHGDRGRHMGWRNHRGGKKVVIVKRGGHHASKTVIKKKTVVR